MNTLIIDTSSNQCISVGLQINGKIDSIKQKIDTRKAQVVLPFLERLLAKHNLQISDISAIKVNKGPGSYTGIRVGVAIANTLGFSLQIPINNNPLGEFVDPLY